MTADAFCENLATKSAQICENFFNPSCMKPTLVLIHGHGVDSSVWDTVYEPLSRQFSIIKPDFSRLDGHESIEAYAERLYSLMEQAQVEKAILAGHSMGGYIALAFAERHPEMVAGLALVHSTAFADDETKKEQRQKALQSLQEYGSEAFIRNTVPNMFGDAFRQQQPEAVDELVKKSSQLPAEALSAGVRAIAGRPDRTQVLKAAAFPVVIIAGRQDKIIPFEKSEALFGMPSQGQPVVLDEAGHLGMLETPGPLVEALSRMAAV